MMRKIIRRLSSLHLTTAGLFYLAVLVVWGTIFQSRNGLYAAQVKIFNSWIFWAGGFFPLPGILTVGAILAVNLLAVSLFTLKYHWRRTGLILIHYGLTLLLIGGFFSGRFSQESYLTLAEGESRDSSVSGREWELVVSRQKDPERPLLVLDPILFPAGQSRGLPQAGASIQLIRYYRNSLPRVEGSRIVGLRPRPLEYDPADDRPGGQFTIFVRGVPNPPFFLWSGSHKPCIQPGESGDLQIRLQQKRLPLPFTVRLVDFEKRFYPGTEIARSFASRVEIATNGARYHAVISMNKPLHRGGFTFYQSSYGENDLGKEISTFAVVKNSARLLPYIATIMTFLGLALHFLLRLLPKNRMTDEK